MNRITEAIFNELPAEMDWSAEGFLQILEEEGITLEDLSFTKRFRYEDGIPFAVSFILSPDKKRVNHFNLSAVLDSDEKGWNEWSREDEMQREKIQKIWMADRGIQEISDGPLRLSNCFDPKGGFASISLCEV